MGEVSRKPVTAIENRSFMAELVATLPEGARPWEDRTLSAAERYASYCKVARQHCEEIFAAMTRAGITEDERAAIRRSPETQRWVSELSQLSDDETPEQFCWRVDVRMLADVFGNNFLGSEAWKRGLGVDVGTVPPIPVTITEALLQCDCPLHPGQKIKDTHLLVLMPETVNGEPYSALKLDELCATKKGSGHQLIYDRLGRDSWKSKDWASATQPKSEWALIHKSDPDPQKVSPEKHFRKKNIKQQEAVHQDIERDAGYGNYREVRVLELMTAVLLYDLVHHERLLADYWLRCEEPNVFGGRGTVGCFKDNGLMIGDAYVDSAHDYIGRALARK